MWSERHEEQISKEVGRPVIALNHYLWSFGRPIKVEEIKGIVGDGLCGYCHASALSSRGFWVLGVAPSRKDPAVRHLTKPILEKEWLRHGETLCWRYTDYHPNKVQLFVPTLKVLLALLRLPPIFYYSPIYEIEAREYARLTVSSGWDTYIPVPPPLNVDEAICDVFLGVARRVEGQVIILKGGYQ
jgi:hypothetical protein